MRRAVCHRWLSFIVLFGFRPSWTSRCAEKHKIWHAVPRHRIVSRHPHKDSLVLLAEKLLIGSTNISRHQKCYGLLYRQARLGGDCASNAGARGERSNFKCRQQVTNGQTTQNKIASAFESQFWCKFSAYFTGRSALSTALRCPKINMLLGGATNMGQILQ